MTNTKPWISFLCIIAVVMLLIPNFTFAQEDLITVESLKSISDTELYEYEDAVITGAVNVPDDSITHVELGLYTSGQGITASSSFDCEIEKTIKWEFDVKLPEAGFYDQGYYSLKVLNIDGEDAVIEVPEFTVLSRAISQSDDPVTNPAVIKKESTTKAVDDQYTAKSKDGAISITFSSSVPLATPCAVEYDPLTKQQEETMLSNKTKKDYYNFYGIGDVKVLDKNNDTVKVTGAAAQFDMDMLLKGAITLDNDYSGKAQQFGFEKYDDYMSSKYRSDEDHGNSDGYKFRADEVYTMGAYDRFYDFDGDLFIYDEDDDMFINENDEDEYYYNAELDDEYDEDDDFEDDGEDADDEFDDLSNDDDDDADEDSDEDSIDETDGVNLYYSNDGLYYYYYNNQWEYDPDMDDGFYYDSFFDVYCFDERCYYYDSKKDAYFIDEEFEKTHPDFFTNIHFMIENQKDEYDDEYDEEYGDEDSEIDEYDYSDGEYVDWEPRDNAIVAIMDKVGSDDYSYVKDYGRYFMNGNFFYKKGDGYYFDKKLNPYQLYADGKYLYADMYYNDYSYGTDESCFYKKKSGERMYLSELEDTDYGWGFGADYKANKDINAFDGYGTGKKITLKKGTPVFLYNNVSKGGNNWADIIIDEDLSIIGNTYTIPRLGSTDLAGITPILDKDTDFKMLHFNSDSKEVESFDASLDDNNIMTVTNAAFSPVMFATAHNEVMYEKNASAPDAGKNNNNGFGVLGMRQNATGDDNEMIPWLSLMIIAFAGFLIVSLYNRREQYDRL